MIRGWFDVGYVHNGKWVLRYRTPHAKVLARILKDHPGLTVRHVKREDK